MEEGGGGRGWSCAVVHWVTWYVDGGEGVMISEERDGEDASCAVLLPSASRIRDQNRGVVIDYL